VKIQNNACCCKFLPKGFPIRDSPQGIKSFLHTLPLAKSWEGVKNGTSQKTYLMQNIRFMTCRITGKESTKAYLAFFYFLSRLLVCHTIFSVTRELYVYSFYHKLGMYLSVFYIRALKE
jgi:hypothetical protein